ncbi:MULTISPECIES: DUF998 domain-containing protein [Nonomuraea]|uniref:DUF998 domain-containing protein n=1 Tax=Nonomuraea ferruginea TaxID=46174 RepID=A0ABT4SSW3_9ACTN|nr:DUF998 domain-containing protein [Nonomuraea ferruginea]MDA0640229.1 DUF998 domain-containing protein [Nonomuraea ferruginea]
MTIIEAKARSRPLLLTAGMLAAPIWILLAAAQAASRTGFDLTRHPISMLSLGDLGWIQVSSFLVTGVMTLCGAAGMRRAGLGGVWGPRLLGLQGLGLIVAGVFPADPGFAFPPGTPDVPGTMSSVGAVHLAGACVSFIAMITCCFVLSRRFGGTSWAVAGRAGGVLLAVGLCWGMSGAPGGPLAMFAGVVAAWAWIAVTMSKLEKAVRA